MRFIIDSIISDQILVTGASVSPISYSSTPDNTPAMSFSCSLSNQVLNCAFFCLVAANDQIIQISIPAKMNPIYQSNTIMGCALYYNSVLVSSKDSINILAPPKPRIINNAGTIASGKAGLVNSVTLCLITDFLITASSTIIINDFPILSNNIVSATLSSASITSSILSNPTVDTKTLSIIINMDIPKNDSSKLCFTNSAVQSSTETLYNSYSIKITSSSSKIIAITSSSASWSPSSSANFLQSSVAPSSQLVGDNDVTYDFKFIPPFTITSILTLQFRLPSGSCTQSESILICADINLFYSCSSNNCDCSFNLDSVSNQSLFEGKAYIISWKSFINPSSTRPLQFQLHAFSGSSSNLMITGTFSLNSITTSSTFNSLSLSFDPSSTIENTITKTAYYIITFEPKITVYPYLNIEIDIPSYISFQNPACIINPSNCKFSTNQKLFIIDPSNQATANINYVTPSFKMTNPECGGSQSIQFTTILYNYQSGDSNYGYPAVIGESTNIITYKGLPCSTTPFIKSFSPTFQGASATYQFDYSGCSNFSDLTHIKIEFPFSYSFGALKCSCGMEDTSINCNKEELSNAIKVEVNSKSCTGIIIISSIINPLLPGPTDSITIWGFINSCEKVYDKIIGIEISTSENPKSILSLSTISSESSQNYAITSYTFKFQLCIGCLISQSSLVFTYLQLTWVDSSMFSCNCITPITLDYNFLFISSSTPSCTFSLGSIPITNNIFSIKLSNCRNPPSSTSQEKIKFSILQVEKNNPSNQYVAYMSDPDKIPYVQSSQSFEITLTKEYSVSNNPIYPYYDSSSFIAYLDLIIISNIGSITFTLIGLERTKNLGTLGIYNEGNSLIKMVSSINSSSITINPFPPSTLNLGRIASSLLTSSKIKIIINNWFKNPKTQSQLFDTTNYGIRIDTTSIQNEMIASGFMGTILLKPLISSCDFPCQECQSSATFCTSCYKEESIYNFFENICVVDCGISTQNKYYNYNGICQACPSGCDTCTSYENAITCKSCIKGRYLYNNDCLLNCPSNYIPSPDKGFCIEGNISFLFALSNGKIAPFPFLIIAVAMIFFALASNLRNEGNIVFVGSNILIQLSSLLLIAYIVQCILCLTLNMGLYVFGITLVSFLIMIATNIIFSVLFYVKIRKVDKRYIYWSQRYKALHIIIVLFGSVFSFHNYRLIYSRYLGFTCLSCRLIKLEPYLNLMKIFTIITTFGVYLLTIIADIIGLCLLDWSFQLNVIMIETLVISVVVIGFSLHELRFSEVDGDLLFGKDLDKYFKSWDQSGIKYKKPSELTRGYSLINLNRNVFDDYDNIKSKSHPTSPENKKSIISKFIKHRVYSPKLINKNNSIINLELSTLKKNQDVLKNQIKRFKKIIKKESRKLKEKLMEWVKKSQAEGDEIKKRKEVLHNSKADGISFNLPDQNQDKSLEEKDLLGSFDRDEIDNSILIFQGKDGRLRDKKGRQVNKYGYLTDDKGNIYKKNGNLAYTSDQFDFEKEYFEPVIVNKKSIQNQKISSYITTSIKNIYDQSSFLKNSQKIVKTNFVEHPNQYPVSVERKRPKNIKEYESFTKRSDQINPLMGDKPSNYDLHNFQFFEDYKDINQKPNKEYLENNEVANEDQCIKFNENSNKNINLNISLSKNENIEKSTRLKLESENKEEENKSFHSIIYDQELNSSIDPADLSNSIQFLNKNDQKHTKIKNFENDISSITKVGTFENKSISKNIEKKNVKMKTGLANKSKIHDTEKIYLQRLENSASKKVHKKIFDSSKKRDQTFFNENLEQVLELNYQNMKNHFQNFVRDEKINTDKIEGPNLFIGNRKQYI